VSEDGVSGDEVSGDEVRAWWWLPYGLGPTVRSRGR